MGYASDMQDLVRHLAIIIKSRDSRETVGQLKDYIAYSEECRGLRSYLYEIGDGEDGSIVIEPDTIITVTTDEDEDGEIETAYVMDAKRETVMATLDTAMLVELDIQDDDGVRAWYYENHIKE